MTVTSTSADGSVEPRPDLVTLTIDGVEMSVPKGTLIIRAAEQLGVAVPRFCDHPLLDPVAACRMCLIEIEGMPKPQPACAVTCSDGMVVKTQMTSAEAEDAQRSIMEFLLINHPLDCPVCDKGGECPLQNQQLTNGQDDTRFDGPKRTFPKPINLSAQVLLDRERCISCARCTRFAQEIAGDPLIELLQRGPQQQVGIADGVPFNSYYSGNTIQICPVGALTSAMYRFRSRPFDLVSTPTACEHCASGCALRTDSRRNTIMRRMAGVDPEVNEEWNCDKGRFAFRYVHSDERLSTPMVRDADGVLRRASWDEALTVAAEGLRAASGATGVITGGRLMVEDAYAYSLFARRVLNTNDIDFRSRPHSPEEEQFLAARVAGREVGPTYADLAAAPVVLLVALEPEDESPIVQLRLRKAARNGTRVLALAPAISPGMRRLSASWLPASPGSEVAALQDLDAGTADLLAQPGAVILVGERAVATPGLLSEVGRLADRSGAGLGWVPRRAGDRGAVEAGALPSLLPGGRPVADAAARVDSAAIWGAGEIPQAPGRDLAAMLQAAAAGQLKGLVVGGARLDDLPEDAADALGRLDFLMVIDTHVHDLLSHAHVVFPVAAAPEKSGTFLDWEGRERPSQRALRTALMSDGRLLSTLAGELGVADVPREQTALHTQLAEFGGWEGTRTAPPDEPAAVVPAGGGMALATWRPLLEPTVLQDGEPYLAATARPQQVWLAAAAAADLGVAEGDAVTVTTDSGTVTAPLVITDVAADTVVVTGDAYRSLRQRRGVGSERATVAGGGQA